MYGKVNGESLTDIVYVRQTLVEDHVTHTSSTLSEEISTAVWYGNMVLSVCLRMVCLTLNWPIELGHTQEPKLEIASSNTIA